MLDEVFAMLENDVAPKRREMTREEFMTFSKDKEVTSGPEPKDAYLIF